jgi:hypothetical protein
MHMIDENLRLPSAYIYVPLVDRVLEGASFIIFSQVIYFLDSCDIKYLIKSSNELVTCLNTYLYSFTLVI